MNKQLFLLVAMFIIMPTWATTKTVTLTADSFGLTDSYEVKTANVDGISFTVDEGYLNGTSNIQMNLSHGNGILYNSTAITGLKSITVNVASGTKTYVITTGATQKPSANEQSATSSNTFNVKTGDTYFQLAVSNGACYFSSIVISYDDDGNANTGGTSGDNADEKYVLVTDVDKLKCGDQLLIANSNTAGSAVAISTSQDNSSGDYYRPGTSVTVTSDNSVTAICPGDDVEIYSLGGNNGNWTFQATSSNYKGKYLACSTKNYNNAYYISELADNGRASISIANDGVANIVFNAGSNNCLRYSTRYKKFECFASNETNNIQSVYIYKKVDDDVTPLAEVIGIGGFKEQTEGGKVKLYLPDSYNARVLHVKANTDGTSDVFIRDDNGGALLMQGIKPNRNMAYNQHLAGWVVGSYNKNSDGMVLFVPDDGLTNTAFLVIADPVTEADVNPKDISIDNLGDNLADWITLKDIDASSNITLQNGLNSKYTAPYNGATFDVSAIAASNNCVYPITHNNVPIITYVIDSNKDFTLPPSDIENTSVRVKRFLALNTWAPLTLPFDYTGFDGIVQEYESLTVGNNVIVSGASIAAGMMNFVTTSQINAGIPYLVKPNKNYSEFIANDVTLKSTAASTITHNIDLGRASTLESNSISNSDNYSFVGVYSPTTLNADNAYKIMDSSGNVTWTADMPSTTVEGTSAYFITPPNQGLHINLEGEGGVITSVNHIIASKKESGLNGIYNIMGEKMPYDWEHLPPGFYIVNGVKTIKR